MISYKDFYKLRISDFFENVEYRVAKSFEFMGKIWVGEVSGFNEFLRLKNSPRRTQSISLDFSEKSITEKMGAGLEKLAFQIKPSMNEKEVIGLLGKPGKVNIFIKGRKEMEYIVGSKKEPYYLSCTVDNKFGVIYVVLVNEKSIVDGYLYLRSKINH